MQACNCIYVRVYSRVSIYPAIYLAGLISCHCLVQYTPLSNQLFSCEIQPFSQDTGILILVPAVMLDILLLVSKRMEDGESTNLSICGTRLDVNVCFESFGLVAVKMQSWC